MGDIMFIDYMQMKFINPDLREIMREIENEFGPQLATSLYRIDDPGVHGTLPLRGVDLREKNYAVGRIKEAWVNNLWQYDYERPEKKVAIYHNTGSGYHLHLQVHKNTRKK
jgi:hypothetical protein